MKDKRTKEQILHLLDHAMEQEEKRMQQIQALENQLAECQKRAENPRHELTEDALPASKVSFRLDYYRTEKKGPLKGIIEHLSTREHRSFTGDGLETSYEFIGKFLPVKAKSRAPVKSPETPLNVPPTEPVLSPKNPEQTSEPLPPGPLSPRIRMLLSDLVPEEMGNGQADPIAPRQAVKIKAPAFNVVAEGHSQHQGSLQREQRFQLEMEPEALHEFCGEPCRAVLSIENLENGHDCRISESCIPANRSLRLPRQPIHLTPGAYRLTATINMVADPRKMYYKESRLVVVR